MPEIGQTVSHYRILEKIGQGGMGEVFLANDTSLQRRVAIKFLSADSRGDETSHHRILREARSAAHLEHSNICTIYEVGSTDGNDFIVMEYVDGKTLADRIVEGPVPVEESLRLVIDVAEALEEAHDNRIIHKDLKPSNIMITRKGHAKVMDFGLAAKLPGGGRSESTADTLSLTQSAQSGGGTPAYMAPEQLLADSLDERSDIFSLGIVFYQLLAGGEHPFQAGNTVATVDRILHEDSRPIREINPSVPEEVETLIGKMLSRDPDQRPRSIKALLESLRQLTRPQETDHRAASRVSDISGRRLTLMVASIVALMLVLVGGMALFNKLTRRQTAARLPARIYMAVLPFRMIGVTGDYAALAGGILDSVNSRLTKLTVRHPLQVVPAGEIREKGIQTLQDAYREFGVNLVMEGSLQQSGENLRIDYRMVDPKSDRVLRGETITAEMSLGPFDLIDRLFASVLSNLDIDPLPEEKSVIAYRPTQQEEAFNKFMTARGYLREFHVTGNIQKAVEALQYALSLDPAFAQAYAALGEARRLQYLEGKEANRVEEALSACNRAVELNNDLPDGQACLGAIFTDTGKYEQAVEKYRRVLDLEPTSDDAYRGLGKAYESLGLFDEAERVYRSAIKLKPDYWAGYRMLGSLYVTEGRYGEAEKQFVKWTDLVPEHYFGYNNLGGVYLYEGRYSEAVPVLMHSIALQPSGEAFSNLGTANFYMRRFGEAANAFEEAIKLNGRKWIIWGNLGDARYWDPAERDRAAEAYRKALALAQEEFQVNARNARLLGYMAYYHAMLNEKEEARNSMKLALAKDPHDPELLFNLAQTSYRLEDTGQALAWLKKAMAAGISGTMVRDTPLFDPLRDDAGFQNLLREK